MNFTQFATAVGIALLILAVIVLLVMIRRLNQARRNLAALNASLESQAQERTAALRQAIAEAEQQSTILTANAARLRDLSVCPSSRLTVSVLLGQ